MSYLRRHGAPELTFPRCTARTFRTTAGGFIHRAIRGLIGVDPGDTDLNEFEVCTLIRATDHDEVLVEFDDSFGEPLLSFYANRAEVRAMALHLLAAEGEAETMPDSLAEMEARDDVRLKMLPPAVSA